MLLGALQPVSYTHLRAHETGRNLVCRLLLEKFLLVLAYNEHFLEYRSIVQQEIREQLESLPPEEPTAAKELQPA